MKIVCKNGKEIGITSMKFSKGYLEKTDNRVVISISGDKLKEIKDENELKNTLSNPDEMDMVTVYRETMTGDIDTGKRYSFSDMIEYSHVINDYDDKIDVMFNTYEEV